MEAESILHEDKNQENDMQRENSDNEFVDILIVEMQQIQEKMDALQQCFDKKIAVDQHKNQLFDRMHEELVGYQDGNVEKMINSIALDIIQLIDSVEQLSEYYSKEEMTERNYVKLLKNYNGFAEGLRDILYRQGIEPYQCKGELVDVRRQKIIDTEATDHEERENTVFKRVRNGYEKDGKVIRAERIIAYKYQNEGLDREEQCDS